jgi:conjugal transfer ATP-binding protein TraC
VNSNGSQRQVHDTADPGIAALIGQYLRSFFPQRESEHRDPAQFATYLPYRAADLANNVIELKHGLGFILEVTPQTGADANDEKLLQSLYRGWPTGTSIQMQLFPSPHFDDLLLRYARLRKLDEDAAHKAQTWGRQARNDNTSRKLARARFEYLKRSAFESITESTTWLLRSMRLAISVSIPCDPSSRPALQELLSKRASMMASLSAAKYGSRVWTPDDLLNFCALVTNPHRLFAEAQPIAYDPGRDLRDQIIDIDTRQLPRKNCIEFTNTKTDDIIEARLYAVRSYPKRFALWRMGGLIGDLLHATLQYPCPYMITIGAVTLDAASTSAWVTSNQIRATQNAGSSMARYSPDIGAKKEDWDAAKKSLDNGEDFVKLYHTLTLFAPPDVMRTAERVADSIWKDQGFTINNIAFIHRPALLASLPLSLSTALEKDLSQLRITTTQSTEAAVALSPLLGEWLGTPTPVMIFAGRRGQPAGFDLYDSPENYNAAIIGTSGSGKSFLIAEIASSYLDINAKVWILDLGRTFFKLAQKRGGEHLEFTSEADLNVNPFSFVVDFEDDYEMLQAVVAKMASPLAPMTDAFQYQALGDAITQTWSKYGTASTITHIRDLLATGRLRENEDVDRRLTDLAVMLSPYATGGPHTRFFDGPSNVRFDRDLTVMEFEELKRSPGLHQVVVMILLFRITSEMYFDRKRRKIFIVDELKQQLGQSDDPLLEKILDEAARRARKYGGSLITATQEGEDYYDCPSLRTSFTLASHKFILKQSPESIDLLAQEKKLAIDEQRKQLLTSIRMVPGAYSEMFLATPEHAALVRLAIDPFAQLLYSNRPQDNVPLDERLAAGMSIDEAIADLIATRGGRAA